MKETAEQSDILDAIRNGYNVSISAVAGSGKTTTAILVDNLMKKMHKKMLLLAFNRMTVHEVKNKGVSAWTYNAFALSYFPGAWSDARLYNTLENNEKKVNLKFKYNLIYLDESQDLTPLYVKFINLLLKSSVQICIAGDPMQLIYTVRGSSNEYMNFPEKYFIDHKKWVHKTLSVSFRLSVEMADFVNNKMYHGQLSIKGTDKIGPVKLIETSNLAAIINNFIVLGYTFDDIMILRPSIKKRIELVHHLCKNYGFNFCTPEMPENCKTNKVLISTIHAAKGLERKIVIVLNFDNSYYRYFGRTEDVNVCQNIWYVAMTRASDYCIAVYNNTFGLPNWITGAKTSTRPLEGKKIIKDLLGFLSLESEIKVLKIVSNNATVIRNSGDIFQIPEEIMIYRNGKNIYEYVNDMTKLIIEDAIANVLNGIPVDIKAITKAALDFSQDYRRIQIGNTVWVNENVLLKIVNRVIETIGPIKEISHNGQIINGDYSDEYSFLIDGILWEIKYAKKIEDLDIMAVFIKTYMLKLDFGYLLNTRDGLLIKVTNKFGKEENPISFIYPQFL